MAIDLFPQAVFRHDTSHPPTDTQTGPPDIPVQERFPIGIGYQIGYISGTGDEGHSGTRYQLRLFAPIPGSSKLVGRPIWGGITGGFGLPALSMDLERRGQSEIGNWISNLKPTAHIGLEAYGEPWRFWGSFGIQVGGEIFLHGLRSDVEKEKIAPPSPADCASGKAGRRECERTETVEIDTGHKGLINPLLGRAGDPVGGHILTFSGFGKLFYERATGISHMPLVRVTLGYHMSLISVIPDAGPNIIFPAHVLSTGIEAYTAW